MSRLTRFSHGVVSGYLLLGANVLFTITSVPLALAYLSRDEFGLWALILTISGYLALLDLGIASSLARLLIDHKDQRDTKQYGSMILSGFWFGGAQAAILLLMMWPLLLGLPAWMKVAPHLVENFRWLFAGQALLLAVGFPTRVFNQILYAWQRADLNNYAQALQFPVMLLVLWIGFSLGWGVLSLLAANSAGWLVAQFVVILACRRLGLLPVGEAWGRARVAHFRELFAFGADVFLIALGTLLITSSQALLVSRYLGMEATAVWSVATRAYTLVTQLVFRIVSVATPAFAEMHVRGEADRMRSRYDVYFASLNWIAAMGAAAFAIGNAPFLELWTAGRIAWPRVNDWLLAAWLVVSTQQAAHTALLSSLKQLRSIKYVLFAEGVVFFLLGIWAARTASMGGIIATSVLCTLAFTWQHGTRTVARLMGDGARPPYWRWQVSLLLTAAAVLPLGLVADRITAPLNPLVRLACIVAAVGAGGLLALRCPAFAPEFRREMAQRLGGRFPWLAALIGVRE